MIEGRKNYAQLGRIAPREHETMSVSRHCEEQSDEAIHSYFAATWIASLALAMTVSTHATLSAVIARLDRAIQYSRDIGDEWRSCGILDTPHARAMTIVCGTPKCHNTLSRHTRARPAYPSIFARSISRSRWIAGSSPAMTTALARRLEPLFGQQPHRGVGVHRLAEGKPLRVFAAPLLKLDRGRIRRGGFRDHVHCAVKRHGDERF